MVGKPGKTFWFRLLQFNYAATGNKKILHTAEPLSGTVYTHEFFLHRNSCNYADGALLPGINWLYPTDKTSVDFENTVGANGG